MAYGTVKVDNVTFTYNSADATTTFSGFYASTTNNLTLSGTASAATFTGTTANFTNVNAQNISVTTALSGLAITGGTAGFTTVTGTTVTGTTANFVSGVFTTRVSGTTITGTTASFTSGVFTSLSGTTHTITSGVFASGTAALPSISFVSDPNTGVFSPGADQLAVATNGTGRLFVNSNGDIGLGTSSPDPFARFYTRNIGLSSSGSTSLQINAATGSNAIIDLGVNSARTAGITSNVSETQFSTLTATPILVGTNGGEKVRITSAGLVGIGTTATVANCKLNVDTGINCNGLNISANGGFFNAANKMGIDNNGGVSRFYSSGANSSTRGSYDFRITDSVGTLDTSAVVIDTSGRVGIGTTDARGVLRLAGSSANAFPNNGGLLWLTDTNAATDYKNWSVSSINGEFGVARGSEAFNTAQNAYKITGAATQGYIGEHIWYTNNSSEKVRIDNSGRLLVGTVTQVGNANGGILQLGSGITFPATPIATTDVNTLDDYEEGTWTPALMAAGYTATYVSNVGKYTKIGNQVFISLYISLSASIAVVPGNGLAIGGLPFSSSTSSNAASTAMTAGDIQNIAYGAGELQLTFYIRTGISDIVGYFTVASAASNVWVAGDIGASAVLIISGSYFV